SSPRKRAESPISFSTTAVSERNRDLQPSKLLLLPYPGLTAWAVSSPSFVGLIGLAALTIRLRRFYRTAIK
ncbi:MAG: hypothetical protein ACI3YC_09275, partial [Alloprevotella sp.]